MPHVFVDSDHSLAVADVYEERSVVSGIGGWWDHAHKVWKVTFTIENLELLLDKLPNVTVSQDMEQKVKEQQEREAKLEELRSVARLDIPISLKVQGLKLPLRNYQKIGTLYAITNGSGILLADEMCVGKTTQSICTAMILKNKGLAKNALIVTPASLKFNWPIEIEKFTDEKYVVIDGTPEERIVQWLRTDVFFFVVNYEIILEDLFGGKEFKAKKSDTEIQKQKKILLKEKAEQRKRILAPIRDRLWGFMAIDEAHGIKNHSSRRSMNIKNLHARFRMALTGTPMDGRLEELHSVMGFVAPGLLGSKTLFFQRHIETDFYGKVTGYKKIDEITKKIQPFFLRRLKKDVLKELPDKVYENRIITLSDEEMKIYKALAEGGHKATKDTEAMVAIIRCKQFCNYPQMVDSTCKKSSKMDAFMDVVDEVVIQNGNKILVFTQYKTMLDVIDEQFKKIGVKFLRIDGDTKKTERARMQDVFAKDNTIDAMIGTEAMSAGLNFQSASYCFNFDDNWSPSIMNQRSDRAHRYGQKNNVTVISFICKDTIEERIREVLYAKSKITSQVLGDETEEMVLQRLGPKDIARLL